MPKVSVIVPTFNRAHFLAETLQSVITQSFSDFEIMVIDDGSTDNTAEIVSVFPVRYFCQNNQGAPAARNKGFELTESEYIVFLDSDDSLLPHALEKGVEILDQHAKAGFSYGQAYLMDQGGRIFGLRKPRSPRASGLRSGLDEIRELVYGCRIPSPTVMVRRSSLEEVGVYDPSFNTGSQDFDLWVRLAKKYSVGYIAEPLAKYRVHSNTISGIRRREEVEQSNSRILDSIFSGLDIGPTFSKQRASAYSYLHFRMAMGAYSDQDMQAARRYLLKTLKTYPAGSLSGEVLQWILLFFKTWIPLPILMRIRRSKHAIGIAIHHRKQSNLN